MHWLWCGAAGWLAGYYMANKEINGSTHSECLKFSCVRIFPAFHFSIFLSIQMFSLIHTFTSGTINYGRKTTHNRNSNSGSSIFSISFVFSKTFCAQTKNTNFRFKSVMFSFGQWIFDKITDKEYTFCVSFRCTEKRHFNDKIRYVIAWRGSNQSQMPMW